MKRVLFALAVALATPAAATAQSVEREPDGFLHHFDPRNWNVPSLPPGLLTDTFGRPLPLPGWAPGPLSSEVDRLRYQQLRASQQAQFQALQAGQYQLNTDQRLMALERRRMELPAPPPQQTPVSGGRRLQPTRDQAPQSQAAAPIQPSAAPPSDARTRGNLPL